MDLVSSDEIQQVLLELALEKRTQAADVAFFFLLGVSSMFFFFSPRISIFFNVCFLMFLQGVSRAFSMFFQGISRVS